MFTLEIDCPACNYSGEVEAWEDPASKTWGWTCPGCGLEHEDDVLDPEDGLADWDVIGYDD